MTEKEELIQRILEKEFRMFVRVPAREPASCQQDPQGFRLMRGAQFSVWSVETLSCYLADLERAEEKGLNLMTLKYARMDDLIPKLHEDLLVENLIDQIVAIQLEWQKEMLARYPHLMRQGRPLEEAGEEAQTASFVSYLRGELDTYSEDTLALLFRDLSESFNRKENLAERIYEYMVQGLGFASLEEAEEEARSRCSPGSEDG